MLIDQGLQYLMEEVVAFFFLYKSLQMAVSSLDWDE